MAKEYPTLFDRVRSSCIVDPHPFAFYKPQELRTKIFQARRFTCDPGMSSMIGEVSVQAFQNVKSQKVWNKAAEFMRTGARLPHKLTWVEYDLREAQKAIRRYPNAFNFVDPNADLDAMPKTEGWLLEQHPQIETAFRATIYLYSDKKDSLGFDTWSFPWAYGWTTDDTPLPWKDAIYGRINGNVITIHADHSDQFKDSGVGKLTNLADIIVGLSHYETPFVGVYHSKETRFIRKSATLLQEWGGIVRRMWAFLSTINDIPVKYREVTATKGYVARRNYHKFLDHRVITLTVPQSEHSKIARAAVAMARRRAHMVRGHWRKDHWHPGERVWIKEHQRGDATLGFVTHDYNVKRDQP